MTLGPLCPHAFPTMLVPRQQLSGNKESPAHPPMPLKTKTFGLQLEGFKLDSDCQARKCQAPGMCPYCRAGRSG